MSQPICLITQDHRQQQILNDCFPASRYQTVSRLLTDSGLDEELKSGRFELVVFHLPHTSGAMITLLQTIQQSAPRPVVVFVDTSSDEQVARAVEAGANAYVVAGLAKARIEPVIELARARFQRCRALHKELADTRLRLDERRDIERAKGILMQSKKLSEDEAYRLLRKLAMDRHLRMGELARTVIRAAELLQA